VNHQQKLVEEFHERFGYPRATTPSLTDRLAQVRLSLIREETNELSDAWAEGDVVRVADALGDLLYVVYGTAVACGIDLEDVFEEVHRSNMTKTPDPGRAKPTKGPDYQKPNIELVLARQERRFACARSQRYRYDSCHGE